MGTRMVITEVRRLESGLTMTLKLSETSPLYQISDLPYLLCGLIHPVASPIQSSRITEKHAGESTPDYLARIHSVVAGSTNWFISVTAQTDEQLREAKRQLAKLDRLKQENLDRLISKSSLEYYPENTKTTHEVIARVTASLEIDPGQTSDIALEYQGKKLGKLFDAKYDGLGFEIITWDYSKIIVGYKKGVFQWKSYLYTSNDEVSEFNNQKFNLLQVES
jgi:hypothetical protein